MSSTNSAIAGTHHEIALPNQAMLLSNIFAGRALRGMRIPRFLSQTRKVIIPPL